MRKISAFNYISLDGFFAGPNGEIDWFKLNKKDKEFFDYTHRQSKLSNTLIFGRTTYEMMKSYWPTPDAIKDDPDMAKIMNNSQKIVFSKTLASVQDDSSWKNIRLFHSIEKDSVVKLKEKENRDFTILGSGSIIKQFANLDLIDEYQLLIVPIVLGDGKQLFKDVKRSNLELVDSRSFKNGIVSSKYRVV